MPKLSELIKENRIRKRVSLYSQDSLFDFTDLTPISDQEVDLFWPFEGSQLERKIALRIATRSADEAYRAIMARGSKGPGCYVCGLHYYDCRCMAGCPACFLAYYKHKGHQCDPANVGSWAKPLVIKPV